MYLFHRTSDIKRYLETPRERKHSIGLVPTSGDLHEGHVALINRCRETHDCIVCTIFYGSDPEKDISSLDKDIDLLASLGIDALFLPAQEALSTAQDDAVSDWNFGLLDQVMEGEFRPGHFDEVAGMTERLLAIIQPDTLFLGQKNFQEHVMIRSLLEQTGSQVNLMICPTIREVDGLALSSQNRKLTPENRAKVSIIYQTLCAGKDMLEDFPPEEIERFALGQFGSYGFRPEYFEIVDGTTLEPVENPAASAFIVACTAVWAGEVRLTDNMIWKRE